ncbi:MULTISPECIES: flagellar basal body P-ring formation chaperone FlgA [unclassified Herbaspirillum]|uniref:flagellar basal body P-ring formation chaperone FlgA n=1 Tax=unclassified Herbaspirillum TaxID=2624150 RepID=UPI000E2E680E|nr:MULTISPECIES: flagellar basal body P-ring formation chaperone FlgA [unclassified Herbaspirillum]RFB68706.1 flagellar basal body P-ring formation protein FlgA [Herbaspirillum sp. 3R-3a1]TFI05614.1 flagellar basal body P-ring formation protein FlgA [Herbaspirillum sp. 3R11]TFI13476.1 flagellar basal body P-ring formation protein FlgA [Herbaspirillum sp. 3R-11]TFI27518.1 flagellar basal body P-ring formation protein FlgA [Herbaspirillum sp. 3C11]
MKLLSKALLPLLLLLPVFGLSALAQTAEQNTPPRQDLGALQKIAEQFMKVQTTGLSGTVNIAVEPVDSRLNLAACTSPQAFMPNGGRLWGRTTIGIKCIAPSPWTIYVRATVQVIAEYIVTAAPLAQGQIIGPNDITKMKGDLSNLPSSIITDPTQAIGRTANISLAMGAPIRQDALRSNRVVQQGQTVRVVSTGPGFQISTEARALTNGSEGQMVQAKTPAGQVVSGIAKAGGILEINY